MSLDPDDLVRLAAAAYEIALQAGQIVLRGRNTALNIQSKADGSPATAADLASEKHIVAALAQLTPDFPVIAEESASHGGVRLAAEQPFWLVDPLDGTKDYIAGESEFCINIALVVGNTPALGVLHGPAYEESFMGIVGHGATRVQHGRASEMSARCPPAAGLTVISSRHHGSEPDLAAYLAGCKIVKHKRMSSALKFGLLAAGEADLYPRFGRVMGWDAAAGHAIILAAGGRVSGIQGEALNYRAPDFALPNLICRGKMNC